MTSQPGARSYDLTRALPSLAGTLTAILDSARYLIPRPGDLSRQSALPGRSQPAVDYADHGFRHFAGRDLCLRAHRRRAY